MSLRQRQPRKKNPKHLEFIRTLPCCICKDNTTTEAAHIRMAHRGWGKSYTGMAEKPDDNWTVPLCGKHHREQHSMGEAAFWCGYRIDPCDLAVGYRDREYTLQQC